MFSAWAASVSARTCARSAAARTLAHSSSTSATPAAISSAISASPSAAEQVVAEELDDSVIAQAVVVPEPIQRQIATTQPLQLIRTAQLVAETVRLGV